MRIKTYSNGGYSKGGFTTPGGTMTGPLILSGDPTLDLHAAPKQYVDATFASFPAGKFTSGILPAGRMPGFVGDAVSVAGTTTLTLISTGISSGSYAKVSVNAKGLVINGSGLVENDLPALPWSKITTGKPTTLAGYGITDALPLSGGVITGDLTLSGDPTLALHAATKQYVDTNVTSNLGISTGDVLTTTASSTPTGYLRCNGGQVSKTTYANLYAIVGDAYMISMNPGSGQPWVQQYQINKTQTNALGTWTNGTSYPTAVHGVNAFVTKNRVYAVGGNTGSALINSVYTAPINADGTIGAWVATTAYPISTSYVGFATIKNYIYGIGGSTGSGDVAVTSIYRAPINPDGTIGAWSLYGNLPVAMFDARVAITKDRLYIVEAYLGGGNRNNVMHTVPINNDGTLGVWATAGSLPAAISASAMIITKSRVYLIGGHVTTGGTYTVVNSTYYAPIASDGTIGSWISDTAFPIVASQASTLVTNGRAYLASNNSGSGNVSNAVYSAIVNADGSLGAWTATGVVSTPQVAGFFFATSGMFYCGCGVTTSGTLISTVSSVPITGGLNDYSTYYDGTYTVTDPANFRLPDFTSTDLFGAMSIIKT